MPSVSPVEPDLLPGYSASEPASAYEPAHGSGAEPGAEYAGSTEQSAGAERPEGTGAGGSARALRHRAHAVDTAPPRGGATGVKGVLLPALIVLAIGSIFVSVYLAAFHAPVPHRLPVAVVGSSQTIGQVESVLDRTQPGGFQVQGYADQADARSALDHRAVYAAYVATGGTPELLYAGANGTGVTATVTGAFGAVAQASGAHLGTADTVDVLTSSSGDTRGLSVFYAAFGVVLAGFMFGSTTYQIAPRLEYRWRMVSLLVFGVLGGLMVAVVAGRVFDALPGPFLGVAGLVTLMAMASGGATMVLIRLLGPAGVSVSSVVLLILGNTSSGGILPAAYLPAWLHPLHAILPVGVGVRAIQGLAYFRDDGLGTGITVLAAWVAVCALALYLRDVWSVRVRQG